MTSTRFKGAFFSFQVPKKMRNGRIFAENTNNKQSKYRNCKYLILRGKNTTASFVFSQ